MVIISVSYRRRGSALHVQIKIMDKIDVLELVHYYRQRRTGVKIATGNTHSQPWALREAAPPNPARVSGERCELLQTS